MDPYLPISLALSNFVDWGSTHCSWKINKGIVNYKYDPIKNTVFILKVDTSEDY